MVSYRKSIIVNYTTPCGVWGYALSENFKTLRPVYLVLRNPGYPHPSPGTQEINYQVINTVNVQYIRTCSKGYSDNT